MAPIALLEKIQGRSCNRVVESLKTRSKNLLWTTTLATNANGRGKAPIYREEEAMKCPECDGPGQMGLTINGGTELKTLSISCPTDEGEGKLSNEPAVDHCPACGIPSLASDRWCQIH